MPKKNGFTLIELLVVITIIGILSAIGLISYRAIFQNAQDAQRQTDLKTIQSALEQYYVDQGFYPLFDSSTCPGVGDGKLRFNCPLTNVSGSGKVYLKQVPNDPILSKKYLYKTLPEVCNNSISSTYCKSYCLYAALETPNFHPASTGQDVCPPPPSGYNLLVGPP